MPVTIRPLAAADLPLLAEFWYDQMALRAQMQPRLRLAPEAATEWHRAMQRTLAEATTIALAAQIEAVLLGAIVARILPNRPGLVPTQQAEVVDLVVDIHTPHTQAGIGRALLVALRARLHEPGITQLIVRVGAYASMEQAFWRGMGAQPEETLFGMDV